MSLDFVGTLLKAVEAVTLIPLLTDHLRLFLTFPNHGVRPSNPPHFEARQQECRCVSRTLPPSRGELCQRIPRAERAYL